MDQGVQWLQGAGKGRRQVRILFTSAGRRIELIEAFTRAAKSLRLKPVWHAADAENNFAAGCIADYTHHVPTITSADYIPALQRIVRKEKFRHDPAVFKTDGDIGIVDGLSFDPHSSGLEKPAGLENGRSADATVLAFKGELGVKVFDIPPEFFVKDKCQAHAVQQQLNDQIHFFTGHLFHEEVPEKIEHFFPVHFF